MTTKKRQSIHRKDSDLKLSDPGAFDAICERYYGRLVSRASFLLLMWKPSLKAEAEDAVGSAFWSFLKAVRCGKHSQIGNPADFWRLMLKITRRRVLDLVNKPRIRREQNLGPQAEWIRDPEPYPDDRIEHEEQFNCLLRLLPSDLSRIALLKLKGYTNKEIALKLNRARVTVSRKLSEIRRILLDNSMEP